MESRAGQNEFLDEHVSYAMYTHHLQYEKAAYGKHLWGKIAVGLCNM